MAWQQLTSHAAKQYKCGYCGFNVANDKGYVFAGDLRRIWICPNCESPTYFDISSRQFPGATPGNEVAHLPAALEQLFREARNCCSVSAFTAAVLSCRKILMHIAVEQKAGENMKFIEYVQYLADNGFIPPNGKGWVDHIRKKGNEATHEITLMTQGDAEELISFVEMLLKFVYEFPSKVPSA